MRYQEVIDLIEKGEDISCEFKRKFTDHNKIAREMVAFANTSGGYLLFGVDDDKTVVGVESEKETAELIRETAEQFIIPPIDYSIEFKELDGKEIVIVEIIESGQKPHRLQDYKNIFDISTAIVCIRVNDKSVLASKEMVRILRANTERMELKKYSLGSVERALFDFIAQNEKISVKELSSLVNISERRASRTLVKLVRAGMLLIHTTENGSEYFTSKI